MARGGHLADRRGCVLLLLTLLTTFVTARGASFNNSSSSSSLAELRTRILRSSSSSSSSSAPPPQPLCADGILSGHAIKKHHVCCASSCGSCGERGDKGCYKREGGADKCCAKAIVKDWRVCETPSDTGCVAPLLTCMNGLPSENNRACCSSSCGVCKPHGCGKRKGGSNQCCPRNIAMRNKACEGPTDTSCVIASAAPAAAGGDTTDEGSKVTERGDNAAGTAAAAGEGGAGAGAGAGKGAGGAAGGYEAGAQDAIAPLQLLPPPSSPAKGRKGKKMKGHKKRGINYHGHPLLDPRKEPLVPKKGHYLLDGGPP